MTVKLQSHHDLWLIHCTSQSNHKSIAQHGLDPRKGGNPQRNGSTSYLADEHALYWAIAHTSNRHHVPVDKLEIWVTTKELIGARRFFGRGIYMVTLPVPREYLALSFPASWVMQLHTSRMTLTQYLAEVDEIPF